MMNNLNKYHIDFSRLASEIDAGRWGPLDKEGMPMVDFDKNLAVYRFFLKKDFGTHYLPALPIQYGLAHFDNFLDTKDKKSKEVFLRATQWCKKNAEVLSNGAAVLRCSFEFPAYNLKPGWISAMTQGLAVSLLIRAFDHTQDVLFKDLAKRFFLALDIDVKSGGCKVIDSNGNIWLEEYPSNPSSFVLNGYIFTLFGVYDYYKLTGSKEAEDLFNIGAESLNNNLCFYDANGWSKYDRVKDLCVNKKYHLLHIQQLKAMMTILKDEGLPYDACEHFYAKWEVCQKSKFCRITILPFQIKSKIKQFSRLLDLIRK